MQIMSITDALHTFLLNWIAGRPQERIYVEDKCVGEKVAAILNDSPMVGYYQVAICEDDQGHEVYVEIVDVP